MLNLGKTILTFLFRQTITCCEPRIGVYGLDLVSGHTTLAIMTVEFLNQEYGDCSLWYGIGGYVAATATGTVRLFNGPHCFSDVIAVWVLLQPRSLIMHIIS